MMAKEGSIQNRGDGCASAPESSHRGVSVLCVHIYLGKARVQCGQQKAKISHLRSMSTPSPSPVQDLWKPSCEAVKDSAAGDLDEGEGRGEGRRQR